mmetsp:Transcript_16306/g.34977  ORF Transcript_16306/g.34977 Transcript_16306/m.34977 type:complete len:259 (+) Transcript_16306:488-1264(+)
MWDRHEALLHGPSQHNLRWRPAGFGRDSEERRRLEQRRCAVREGAVGHHFDLLLRARVEQVGRLTPRVDLGLEHRRRSSAREHGLAQVAPRPIGEADALDKPVVLRALARSPRLLSQLAVALGRLDRVRRAWEVDEHEVELLRLQSLQTSPDRREGGVKPHIVEPDLGAYGHIASLDDALRLGEIERVAHDLLRWVVSRRVQQTVSCPQGVEDLQPRVVSLLTAGTKADRRQGIVPCAGGSNRGSLNCCIGGYWRRLC